MAPHLDGASNNFFFFFVRPYVGDKASPEVCKSLGGLGFADDGEALLPQRRPAGGRTRQALFVTSEAPFVGLVSCVLRARSQQPARLRVRSNPLTE